MPRLVAARLLLVGLPTLPARAAFPSPSPSQMSACAERRGWPAYVWSMLGFAALLSGIAFLAWNAADTNGEEKVWIPCRKVSLDSIVSLGVIDRQPAKRACNG